jgi:hypothetical protein
MLWLTKLMTVKPIEREGTCMHKYMYTQVLYSFMEHRRRQGVGGCERPPFGKQSLKLTVKFRSPEFFF